MWRQVTACRQIPGKSLSVIKRKVYVPKKFYMLGQVGKANSAGPYQSDQSVHCLPFHMLHLNALLYWKTRGQLFKTNVIFC